MPNKIKSLLTKEELKYLYHEKNMSQVELCKVLKVKSYITVRRILHEYGIDTNRNQMKSKQTRQGMTDNEFKTYLEDLYYNKLLSINQIAKKISVTTNTIRRYFKKYDIKFRETSIAKKITESGNRNPNWHGGRNLRSNGYIEVYMPNHPFCNSRGCVYEHRLVVEKHIGRYLNQDEIIHHIDLNPTNNEISNLKIMTAKEHKALHNRLNPPRRKKGGGSNGND